MNDISVNDTTPIKDYEIWNDKNLSFFVIPRHEPWIDDGILFDRKICDGIIDYTQKDNKIIEVYNLNADEIVTKYYDGWYPFLIKSSSLSVSSLLLFIFKFVKNIYLFLII